MRHYKIIYSSKFYIGKTQEDLIEIFENYVLNGDYQVECYEIGDNCDDWCVYLN
jgi:hypothetical protein